MRRLVALALATACYRPSSNRCSVTVGDPTCASDGGGDDDAPLADMMIDGIPSPDVCVLPTAAPQSDTPLTNVFGTYFIGVFGVDFPAAMRDDNDGNAIIAQYGQSFAGTFLDVATPIASETFDAPRLAPNGHELFLRVDDSNVDTHVIALTTRAPNAVVWTGLAKLKLMGGGLANAPDAAPSPPTTTDPRRMVISYGTRAIEEYVELDHDPLTWQFLRSIDIASFGLGNYSGEATLTADAHFLVVRAKETTTFNAAYTVARSADGGFDNAAVLLPGTGTSFSVNEPYLAPDCTHLFYNENGLPPQVHIATY